MEHLMVCNGEKNPSSSLKQSFKLIHMDVSILYNYTCGRRLSLYTVYQFALHISKGNQVKGALFLHFFEIYAYRDPAAN